MLCLGSSLGCPLLILPGGLWSHLFATFDALGSRLVHLLGHLVFHLGLLCSHGCRQLVLQLTLLGLLRSMSCSLRCTVCSGLALGDSGGRSCGFFRLGGRLGGCKLAAQCIDVAFAMVSLSGCTLCLGSSLGCPLLILPGGLWRHLFATF